MSEIIRIPEERIKILIGTNKKTKEKIEEKCNVSLKISDSEVEIVGEPADIFFAQDIVKAIGRGFEPRKAFMLLKPENAFYLISLRELASTEKTITRMKGRVIGDDGKIKIAIEDATDSFISVYGSTIAIISNVETINYAKEAISMIINGAMHASVLAYLSKARRKILEAKFRS
ncbi:MAG: KH domain-containing protein [Candidatus Micrarchaeota archaeon]|nr:KH domain-containing protein [Candidatus Micrarchaeota archaeon]MBU1681819.1 KH domain-containing protein [Candidatus Micrarchaeota archaeon]